MNYQTTVVPRPGVDYKTSSEVLTDWEAGKDCIIADLFNRWDGKPMSRRDEINVKIRFNKLRDFIIVGGYEG